MILLIIISNNILLSLLIALTNHSISNGLFILYTSLLSYCNFEILFTNILFVETQPFLFGLSHGALQLIKIYRVKPA